MTRSRHAPVQALLSGGGGPTLHDILAIQLEAERTLLDQTGDLQST
jgi:hypothetical protein